MYNADKIPVARTVRRLLYPWHWTLCPWDYEYFCYTSLPFRAIWSLHTFTTYR